MKKIKLASISVLGLALAVSLIPISAFAQTPAQQAEAEARCTTAKTKLAAKITSVTTLQTERTNQYTSINERVNRLVVSSAEANYLDTQKLTTAHDAVKKSIDAYSAQATAYKTSLEKTQAVPCTQTTEFTRALTVSRAELVKLRTANTSVKTSIKQDAVPAMQNYAAWLKTNTAKVNE